MLATSLDTPSPVAGPGHLEALRDALETERRLLDALLEVLLRQRSGVASDDLAAIDDSVFGAQRVLRTLAEARRRRRALLALVTGRDDVALTELEDALDGRMTPALRASWLRLQDAARTLADELERNRRILQGAITSGERLLRTLTGRRAETPTVYGPASGGAARPAESSFLDRQV